MNIRRLILYISFFVPLSSFAHSGDYTSIEFIKNEGQWKGPFVYKASFGNIDIFLEKTAFTYMLGDRLNHKKLIDYKTGKIKDAPKYFYHTYKVNLINANTNAEIVGSKPRSYYNNYFLGNDPALWKTKIHPELNVDYKNIYNNIDIHIASENNSMKYDFIVRAGGNAEEIVLEIEGADDVKIKDKNLIIETSVGEVKEMAPYAYQYINGVRTDVPCKYKLKDNQIAYVFPKGYDKSQTLIIDPNVVFSTFVGSGSDSWGFTATYDNAGNFYAGGAVGGGSYPTTVGPSYAGGDAADGNPGTFPCDVVVTKFNSAGTAIVYSTFIGGSSQDQPHSMVVDGSGNLFIAGRTYSSTYPNTTGGSHNGRSDIMITKLDPTGALSASTLIGGSGDDGVNITALYTSASVLKHSYADDARSEVLVDNAGNVYLASCTRSSNFPTVNASKSTLSGTQDGVVLKLNNNLTNTLWSTYIGGNSEDAAYVLAFNTTQSSVYVSGGTASSNFPGNAGTFGPSHNGGVDGFITKYQNYGSYIVQRSTLVGRGSYDQCFGIQVDDDNNVYVMGSTLGGSFPVTTGVYSNANSSQFILKLDSTLSTNIYSTVFGSGNSSVVNISPVAFLVDTCQNVYISGWGGGNTALNNGNTNGMPTHMGNPAPTPPNILTTTTNGQGFYFIVFSKNATALLFAGHFSGGGPVGEHVDGGTSRFNRNGEIYQAICGGCNGSDQVPTTPNAYSTTNGSTNCNIVALKIAFNLGSVSAKANASPNTTVCLGDPINFNSNGSANATGYEWDFGDGSTGTGTSPSHTYTTGGNFQVRMVAVNPNACKTRDTVFLTVVVDTNRIDADFSYDKTDSCTSYTTTFTNNSKYGNPAGPTSFLWEFGDGTSYSGVTPPPHNYPDTGTYIVKLTMTDPNACNSPDTITKIITFNNSFVKAEFEAPPTICEKSKAVLVNKSTNAKTFVWSFGNGSSSTITNPEPIYDSAGIYTIKLYTYNPETCNGVDSIEKTLEVKTTPTASFRHEPIIPETNEPILFTNYSVNATSYIWDFGDGTGSSLFTPKPKFYRKTGDYDVCLQALNDIGCSDTVCRRVSADVYPLADVPSGFSPNGDGNNDILYVRGYGIEIMSFKIFNRWGEMIFESTDQDMGWDGTYKNVEQPVEAYAYSLSVTFLDGTTFNKKGNVTLLR